MRTNRQRNVFQQNSLTESSIRQTALHWRDAQVPVALRYFATDQGVDWDRTIILRLDVDFPGMPSLFGVLLTQSETFIYFEIETDVRHQVIESVEAWEDVTAEQNLDSHNRGFGVGYGAIAIGVRRQLSKSTSTSKSSL